MTLSPHDSTQSPRSALKRGRDHRGHSSTDKLSQRHDELEDNHIDEDHDENESDKDNDGDDGDDDDDSTTQLAHSEIPVSPAAAHNLFSSAHSDLKQAGSPVKGNAPHLADKHALPHGRLMSTPNEPEGRDADPLTMTPKPTESRLSTDDILPTTPADSRGPTPTLRAQSGTPATLGGFRPRQNPVDQSFTETEHDGSTITSDLDDDMSQVAPFDFAAGEEPSEYVPPTTAKVGGFGVGTDKVKAHNDASKGASTDKAGINGANHGKMELPSRKGLANEESGTWGANFWCVIEQPRGQSFFANPQTGECAWAVPSGTLVLPPRPQGQWWELYDEEQKRAYYYHTRTKETQWEKPVGFVIPLASIQESTLGKRFSRLELDGQPVTAMPSNGVDKTAGTAAEVPARSNPKKQPPPPQHAPSAGETLPSQSKTAKKKLGTSAKPWPSRGPPPQSAAAIHRNRSGTGLATIPSSTDLPSTKSSSSRDATGRFLAPPANRRAGSYRSLSESSSPQTKPSLDLISLSSAETRKLYRRERDPVKRKRLGAYQDAFAKAHGTHTIGHVAGYQIGSPTFQGPRIAQLRSAPIFVERRRSISMGPTMARQAGALRDKDERVPALEEFAAKHFAVHRVGLLRRRYPLKRLVRWQREPLRSSLLPLSSNEARKDALRIFKVILRYLGDRTNPVFWPKVPPSHFGSPGDHGSPSLSYHAGDLAGEGNQGELPKARASQGSEGNFLSSSTLPNDASGPTVLEEVRWLLERALINAPLRDEVFAQTMKQMTANGSDESWLRGWVFLCVVLSFFHPSKSLGPCLHSFIQQNKTMQGPNVSEERQSDVLDMAEYCQTKMSQTCHLPFHRTRGPLIADIQAAQTAAFDPHVFGQSLEVVMARQAERYPDSAVPIVLRFLTRAMLSMDCLSTPGIFRLPGDADMVYELQRRIDQGKYTLKGLIDTPVGFTDGASNEVSRNVSVLASTFKLWLRELKEPIFAEHMYNACLKASDNSDRVIEVCQRLDKTHLRVVLYVVAFLQLFCTPAVMEKTQMGIESIALIFTPNFVRSPSKNLEIVNNNFYYEKKFVENLLRHLPCQSLDRQFRPSFDVDLPWTTDAAKGDGLGSSTQHALPDSVPSGIGGNGAGLSSRSRKSSMVKVQ